MLLNRTLITVAITASLSACHDQSTGTVSPIEKTSPMVSSTAEITESTRAMQLYDTIYDEAVDRDPVWQTYLGIKKDYDKWNDYSEQFQLAELNHTKANLKRLLTLDTNQLNQQTLLSYELMTLNLNNKINDYRWRHHDYPVNQMRGVHSKIPAFLINQHSIDNTKEAKDYIARVKGSQLLIEQLVEQLKIRSQKGIIAPKFVFVHVIRDAKNLISGLPFNPGKDSALLADFKKKLAPIKFT